MRTMRYSRGGRVQVGPPIQDAYLEAAHRQHQVALARESWAPDRERLRALVPLPPTLARLILQLPAPRGRTPS